ncbi:Hypothetical_protein [Hexamita inflata]|uniref:Hypothetical_protein n=1 Tax=Hexamita inflata TaxID=28002 RepID=A0AA86R664_9EUKA|nr:Hypothetical protein HINF_LOCUS55571 [Hexamita inflata]
MLTSAFNLCNTGVSDIWTLSFHKNLSNLSIQQTCVVDLHPLQFQFGLYNIFAANSCVIDVTPLKDLIQLRFQSLKTTKYKILVLSVTTRTIQVIFTIRTTHLMSTLVADCTIYKTRQNPLPKKFIYITKSNQFTTFRTASDKYRRKLRHKTLKIQETKKMVKMALNNILGFYNKQAELLIHLITTDNTNNE